MLSQAEEHSAFCRTCPLSDDVTTLLARFGLKLIYSRPVEKRQQYRGLPPLPAQFHYEDDWGTQVLFLAGPDNPCLADDDDEEETSPLSRSYPPHASRFWIIVGAHPLRACRIQEELATRFGLHWDAPHTALPIEHAA